MNSDADPVYVFDLDGVITDARNSHVDERVVERMYGLLNEGKYAVVNTGRSYEWVEAQLVSRLKSRDDAEIFGRFIAVCEKGGEYVEWHDGKVDIKVSEFALPQPIHDQAKQIYDDNQASLQTMFWDATKRTMATLEKVPTVVIDDFREEQLVLLKLYQSAFAGQDVRVDQTNISIDVESMQAGKDAGANVIYHWLLERDPQAIGHFISIGDSISDYEMARYFARQGARSTFVYVGKPAGRIEHHDNVEFVITSQQYAAGVMEFLDDY